MEIKLMIMIMMMMITLYDQASVKDKLAPLFALISFFKVT